MATLLFLGRLEDLAGASELTVAGGPIEQVLAAQQRYDARAA